MKITGVTFGWDFYPTLCIDDKYTLPRFVEDRLHKEYYPDGSKSWPKDLITGELIPIQLDKVKEDI